MKNLSIPLDIKISTVASGSELVNKIGKEINRQDGDIIYSTKDAQAVLHSVKIQLGEIDGYLSLRQGEDGSIFLEVTDDPTTFDRQDALDALEVMKFFGKKADYHTRVLRELSEKYHEETPGVDPIKNYLLSPKVLEWIQKAEIEQPQREEELKNVAFEITDEQLSKWKSKQELGSGDSGCCYLIDKNVVYKSFTYQSYPLILDKLGKIDRNTAYDVIASYVKDGESLLITPDYFIIQVYNRYTQTETIYQVKSGGELVRRWIKNELDHPEKALRVKGLIMRKAPGNTLKHIICEDKSCLDLNNTFFICKTLLNQYLQLKKRNFLHWDINTDNVLFDPKSHVLSLIDTKYLYKLKDENISYQTKNNTISVIREILNHYVLPEELDTVSRLSIKNMILQFENNYLQSTSSIEIPEMIEAINEMETQYETFLTHK